MSDDRLNAVLALCELHLGKTMTKVLTDRIKPQDGVVVSTKDAATLVMRSKRDYDQRVDFALANLQIALSKHTGEGK